MPMEKPPAEISFNNIRVNLVAASSGIFAGSNIEYLWRSDNNTQFGFGSLRGDDNSLENTLNIVTDPESSSELAEYFEGIIDARIGKRGL